MDITCITFDWGDTLAANNGMPYLHVHRTAIARFGEELAALNNGLPEDWHDRAMRDLDAVWHDTINPVKNPDWREADMEGIIDNWIKHAGVDGDAATPARTHMEAVWTNVVRPYGGAAQTLAGLKAMGYRLGILSHVAWPPAACRAWYERWGLAQPIDFYSLSSEVGWIKPNHKHYAHAVAQAGVPAKAILHVGDHPMRDITGAKEFGLHTCLRLTEGIYPVDDLASCKPDLAVASIDELLELLPEIT